MLRQYLPEQIAGRSKSGFGIPLDTSLGLEKRQAIESMLTSREARIRPLIDENYTQTISRRLSPAVAAFAVEPLRHLSERLHALVLGTLAAEVESRDVIEGLRPR